MTLNFLHKFLKKKKKKRKLKETRLKKLDLVVLPLLKAASMKLDLLPNPQFILCQTPSILGKWEANFNL